MDSATVWGANEDKKIEMVSLTADKLEGALQVIRESFFIDENICKAIGLLKHPKAMKELEELCISAAKLGISVIGIDKETKAVAGVAFNMLHIEDANSEPYYEEYIKKNIKEDASRALIKFMLDVDSRVNLFQFCGIKSLLEIMFLAVLPNYRKRGVGKALCEATINLGRRLKKGENVKTPIEEKPLPLKPVPEIVTAVFTSFITQKIGQTLGFERVVEIDYKEFTYKGKTYKEVIGSHTPTTTLEFFRL